MLIVTLCSTLLLPVGPVFDNAYHHFLRNTIVEDTAGAFASNQSPFTEVFPIGSALAPLSQMNWVIWTRMLR